MRKWLIVVVACVLISGCSFNRAWKWIENMDWERDDQTIRIVDIICR